MAAGRPGWVGRHLEFIAIGSSGTREVRAQAWLDRSGTVVCTSPELTRQWATGIVGRADRGRLFPPDGQAFLDELPFAYRSPYLMAVPVRSLAEEVGGYAADR